MLCLIILDASPALTHLHPPAPTRARTRPHPPAPARSFSRMVSMIYWLTSKKKLKFDIGRQEKTKSILLDKGFLNSTHHVLVID